MTLTRVDQSTGALTPVGDGGLVANALGHNPEDGYLYGIDRDTRTASCGCRRAATALGAATGAPDSWGA